MPFSSVLSNELWSVLIDNLFGSVFIFAILYAVAMGKNTDVMIVSTGDGINDPCYKWSQVEFHTH
jgi:hypothetical protein